MDAWKKLEQHWARWHETVRTGPRGEGLPDLLDAPLSIECKLQKKRTLRNKDIAQARENAEAKGQLWALILHEKHQPHTEDIVVLPAAAYLGLLSGRIGLRLSQETLDRIDDMIDNILDE